MQSIVYDYLTKPFEAPERNMETILNDPLIVWKHSYAAPRLLEGRVVDKELLVQLKVLVLYLVRQHQLKFQLQEIFQHWHLRFLSQSIRWQGSL